MTQRKHFTVTLARLVRETVTITVKADSREDLETRLSDVYKKAEEHGAYDGEWHPDYEWGADEGTHEVGEEVEDFESGQVVKI